MNSNVLFTNSVLQKTKTMYFSPFFFCYLLGFLFTNLFVRCDFEIEIPAFDQYENCPNKVVCDEEIEPVIKELGTFIKSISPIKEANTPFCHELIATGSYTLYRSGTVYSCPLNDDDECSINQLDLGFEFLNFTCKVNMDQVMEKMKEMSDQGEDIAKKLPGGGPPLMGKMPPSFPGMPKMEALILGNWLTLEVIGKVRLCKKGNTKNVAEAMRLKTFAFDRLTLSCSGDPKLDAMCEGEEAKQQIKEGIGASIQPILSKTVSNAIDKGPADIGRKFSCDYAKSNSE